MSTASASLMFLSLVSFHHISAYILELEFELGESRDADGGDVCCAVYFANDAGESLYDARVDFTAHQLVSEHLVSS